MRCKDCINLFDLVDEDDNLCGKWCSEICDSPDIEIDRECNKFKLMTNAARIRNMTDEEFAERNVFRTYESRLDYDYDETPIEDYYPVWCTSDGSIFDYYEEAVKHELWWLHQPVDIEVSI